MQLKVHKILLQKLLQTIQALEEKSEKIIFTMVKLKQKLKIKVFQQNMIFTIIIQKMLKEYLHTVFWQ